MKAAEYAPAGPFDTEPRGGFVPRAERAEALLDALDGVPFGAWDMRIVEWLTGCDDPTLRVVVSLLLRVRAAGAAEVSR